MKWSLTLTDRLGHHVQEMDRETALPTFTLKLFTLTNMEKSKGEKSPRVKERKKTSQKKERNSSILQKKKKKMKKSLAESEKGSWFGQTPSTISASAENLEQAIIFGASSFFTRVLPLPLASLAIILRRRLELKLTEPNRKKKKLSRKILTYCHKRWEVLLFHWFAVLSGVIVSRRGDSCLGSTGRKNGFTLNLPSTKMFQTYVYSRANLTHRW